MRTAILISAFVCFYTSAYAENVSCEEKQACSTQVAKPYLTHVDEVGLTSQDGEYQLWRSFPVDRNWNTSDLKTPDGENLDDYLKAHPQDRKTK